MEVVVKNPDETGHKGSVVEQRNSGGKTLGDEQESRGLTGKARKDGARVSENGDGTKIMSGNGVGVEDDIYDSGNLEDSEMNGVSSLLKMKQHFDEKGNANSYDTVDSQQEEESEEEEEEEEEHGFQVGDFVWGKIKSHPWWPGQIYDSSDASDLALKVKRKGRLLVAYFGDGTFAWCRPSQLKLFEENFSDFSGVSSSRGFVNAVEEAVEEMGRHVERLMTEQLGDERVARTVAVNAGIKEGVIMPNVRREIVSSLSFDPREILRGIGALAQTLAFSDLLELEVLKRKISAFYQSKGKYSLIEYHEAQTIPGLEDKDVERGVKPRGPKGSSEEDGLNPGEPHKRSLEQCSGFPEHRLHHRRKQKSIAEILETDTAAQAKVEAEAANAGASTGRKKRKRDDEVKDIEKASIGGSTTRLRRKVSKLSDIENAGQKQEEENSKEKTLSRKRKRRVADAGDDDASEKREETTDVEESDKKKTLDSEKDGDSTPLASLRKKVDVPRVEMDSGNGDAALQTPNDSLSRERKKSKYLSPPYTSQVGWKTKKSEIEAESLKVSSQTRVGERMTNAAENLVGANGGRPLDQPGETSDLDSGHQESSDELRKAIDFLRSGAPTKEVRDRMRVAALTPQHPKDHRSDHRMMREFISIYRSFTYHNGANNKMLHREQSKYKENERNGKEQNETGKPSSKKDRKSEKLEAKPQMEEQDSRAELFVMFGPGSDLPKKDDLIKIYRKFGPLDEEKTEMFDDNLCARVAFMNPPDAEAAFESSQGKCPFTTSSSIKFRLKFPSGEPGEFSERTTEKEPENPRIDIGYVKEKLDAMRSMVGKSEGGMTEELKVKLEEEMRKLMEEVGKMVVVGSS